MVLSGEELILTASTVFKFNGEAMLLSLDKLPIALEKELPKGTWRL